MECDYVMSEKILNLSDVEVMGHFVVDQIYYVYERSHDFGMYRKYLGRFSPKEKVGAKFLFAVKYLGDNKFSKVDG